ncbi:MAG: Fur family transcriptional regulator [Rhodospirillaceae bacterium]|nr:Fur family transcriptional regulator [Rhodospirillaceae bacterium]
MRPAPEKFIAKMKYAPPADLAFPAPGHDHRGCTDRALSDAAAVCATRGGRLTEIRRRVLEAVWDSHAPLGAYDILARLNRDGGRNVPMAVYRALDFLMEHGLVHRLASRNAFIGCRHPGDAHSAQFLICEACGTVAELASPAVHAAIQRAAAQKGFTVAGETIEISGRCPHCR